MRRIGFSLNYPNYHPKKGQKTYFVEKVWESIYLDNAGWEGFWPIVNSGNNFDIGLHNKYEPKHHTIRAGHRWKAGDWFQPFCWSGRPRWSKPILFAPPIQIVKTWDIEIVNYVDYELMAVQVNGRVFATWLHGFDFDSEASLLRTNELAKNDGLKTQDLIDWFTKSPDFKKTNKFSGQILTWSNEVEY